MTRRTFAVAVALVLGALTGCAGGDRYALRLGPGRVIATAQGVTALAASGGTVYYAVGGDVFRVEMRKPETPVLVAHMPSVDSLAVFGGQLYASRTDTIELVHAARLGHGNATDIWLGRSLAPKSHVDFDAKGGLYISMGGVIEQIDRRGPSTQVATEVSDGWTDAYAFNVDEHNRIFVADQAPPDGKAFVARGRENDHAKRRRFATALPEGSVPSGLATRTDELLVCRPTQHDVFRLHIGIDNTPRRRAEVPGVVCDGAITTAPDGSVITATDHDIRRYPPRR